MADIFIKNTNGEIWKNTDGAILKAKKFNEIPIQQGLSFWGAADPNYLTLVDGLVSEAYDIRGTGAKMIQNTVANRLIYEGNYIRLINSSDHLAKISENASSMFIVCYIPLDNTTNNPTGIGKQSGFGLGVHTKMTYYVNSTSSIAYVNDIKYNPLVNISGIGSKIMHTITNPAIVNSTIKIGDYETTGQANFRIYEWGWYDRVLTEMEVIYNINALNMKWGVF